MGDVFTFAAVYAGYRACRRRKRGTANAQRYELRLLDHLVDTAEALQSRHYTPCRSLCFVARQPKAREIHAADFSDRVVHHVLVPQLEALFEPIFIHDLYSNRRGKGIHAAVARLASFMRAVSDNGHAPGYFLQLDIRSFFVTIDQAILFRLINRRLKKAVAAGRMDSATAWDLSWLTRVLLKQDFRTETRLCCTLEEWHQVPEYKRLTAAPPGKGLPIGNLTSQFFANVYLNELDQFIKHQLKARYYLRYVDDFILLDPDPKRLADWREKIDHFLSTQLALALKPGDQVRRISAGANFLGYIVRPHYRLVRRRVVGHLRERLAAFARVHVRSESLSLPPAPREALRAVVASYLGHFTHANTHRLRLSLFSRHAWLRLLFDDHLGAWRPRWHPLSVTSLRSQWAYFAEAYAPALPLIQLGNRVALFGGALERALALAPWLGRWRAGRAESRPGLPPGHSWPLSQIKGIGRSLRAAGQAYAFIAEEGYLPGGMKRRVLRYLFQPIAAGQPLNGMAALTSQFFFYH